MNNLGLGPMNILAARRANQMRLMQMGRAPSVIGASAPRPGPDMGTQLGQGLGLVGNMLGEFAAGKKADELAAKEQHRQGVMTRAAQAGAQGVPAFMNPDNPTETLVPARKPGAETTAAVLASDPATAADALKMQASMMPHQMQAEREQSDRDHETQQAALSVEQRVALAEKLAPGNATVLHYAKMPDPKLLYDYLAAMDKRSALKRETLTDDEERDLGLDPRGVYQRDGSGTIETVQGRAPAGPPARYVTMHHPNRPDQPVTVEEGSEKFHRYLALNYIVGQPPSKPPGALVNLKGPGGDARTVYANSPDARRLISQGYIRENRGDVLDEIMAAALRNQSGVKARPTVPASGAPIMPSLKTLEELDGKLADGSMKVGDPFKGPSGNTWRVVDRQGNVEAVEGGSAGRRAP